MASDILVTFDANLGGNALVKLEEIKAQLDALVKGTHEIKVNVNGHDVIKQLNNIASGKSVGKIGSGKNGIASGLTKSLSANLKTQKSQIEGMISSLQKSYGKLLSNPLKDSASNQKLLKGYNQQIANLQRALNVVGGGREIGPKTMQGYQKGVIAYSNRVKAAYAEEAMAAKEAAAVEKAAARETVAAQEKATKQIEKSQVKRRSATSGKSESGTKSGLTGAIKLQTAELQTQKQLLNEMMSTVTGARRTIRNSPLLSTSQKADELGRLKLLMDDINRYQNATKTLGYNSPEAMRNITKQVDGVRQRVAALKEEEAASKRVAAAEKDRAKAAQQQEQKYWKDYAARRKAWEQEIAKTSKDTTSKTGQSAAKQVTDTKRMLSDLKSIEKNILSKPLANSDRQSQSLGYIKSLREELERFPNANSAMASNMQSRLNNISKLVEGYRATENAAKAAAQAQAKESAAAEKASAKQAAAFERQTASMQKRIQQFMDKNPRVAGTSYEQQLQGLTSQMQARVSSGKGTAKDLKSYEDQFKRIKAAAADAGKVGQTLGQSIAGAVKQFGGWMLVTHSIMTVINSIKGMIANVRDLDVEMTELKKVTNETDSAYEEFFDRAKVRAKETGATLTDTIRASSDMARLGYSIPEAEQMADAATIYKNVGDGIENIDEASQSIISSIKAFGMEATDSLQIVDRFNEVGNNFAISSKGIGDALVRSASALAAGGNTLDESIALITAGNEVVQDPEKMGTVLKTLSMYLRAAKTEASDAGLETDEMADSVSKLRGELLSLTGGQVDIMSDEDWYIRFSLNLLKSGDIRKRTTPRVRPQMRNPVTTTVA